MTAHIVNVHECNTYGDSNNDIGTAAGLSGFGLFVCLFVSWFLRTRRHLEIILRPNRTSACRRRKKTCEVFCQDGRERFINGALNARAGFYVRVITWLLCSIFGVKIPG